MAPKMSTLRKVVTEKEIKSGRIALPATVRDRLLPNVAENTKNPISMVDENGESHDIIVKVRDNGTKPEIMARGGRKFVLKRGLSADDALDFSDGGSAHHVRVRVEKRPRLAPTHPPVPQPPGLPTYFSFITHASDVKEPPPPQPTPAVALELGLSINGSHRAGLEPPPPTPAVGPELGLSINGSCHAGLEPHPPTPAVALELGLSIVSDHARRLEPVAAPPMAFSSSAGEILARVKLEVQEVGPTLELTLGSSPPLALLQDQGAVTLNLLHDYNFSAKPGSSEMVEQESKVKPAEAALFLGLAHPKAAYVPAAREVQEPKPPTALVPPPPAAEFDLSAPEPVSKSSAVLLVPGAPAVAKAKAQNALVYYPKAVAPEGGWIDISTPYDMMKGSPAVAGHVLAEPTPPVVPGTPACCGGKEPPAPAEHLQDEQAVGNVMKLFGVFMPN